MEIISTLCGVFCFLSMVPAPIVLIVWLVLLITKNEKKKQAKYVFLGALGGFVLSVIIGMATYPECEHNWETTVKTVADCENAGVVVHKCAKCDCEEVETIPATGHSFTEEIVQAASCSATGIAKKTCSLCNKAEEIVLDKMDHTYEYTTTKAPTFEEKGIKMGTCTVCGHTQEEDIFELGTIINPGEVTVSELVAEMNSDIDAAKKKYNGKWIKITGKVLRANDVLGMTRFQLYGDNRDSGLRIVCWVENGVLKPFDYVGETHTFLGSVIEITTVNSTEIEFCTIIE